MDQPNLFVVPYRKQGWIATRIEGVGLGAMRQVTVRVLVQDFKDRPMSGIAIKVWDTKKAVEVARGETSGSGTAVIYARIETDAAALTVSAELPEGEAIKTVSVSQVSGEVIAFRSVEEAPQPLVNTMEIAAGAGGAALFAAGEIWDIKPMSILGEILVIAAIFERVGRGL